MGGSKITADGDCSHEIERRLLLGRKAISNLDSMLKSGDITLPTKVYIIKAMVFPPTTHTPAGQGWRGLMRGPRSGPCAWKWRDVDQGAAI